MSFGMFPTHYLYLGQTVCLGLEYAYLRTPWIYRNNRKKVPKSKSSRIEIIAIDAVIDYIIISNPFICN